MQDNDKKNQHMDKKNQQNSTELEEKVREATKKAVKDYSQALQILEQYDRT